MAHLPVLHQKKKPIPYVGLAQTISGDDVLREVTAKQEDYRYWFSTHGQQIIEVSTNGSSSFTTPQGKNFVLMAVELSATVRSTTNRSGRQILQYSLVNGSNFSLVVLELSILGPDQINESQYVHYPVPLIFPPSTTFLLAEGCNGDYKQTTAILYGWLEDIQNI